MRSIPLVLVMLAACSDYDLYRPKDDIEEPVEEDTGVEVIPEEPDIEVEPATLEFGSLFRDCTTDPQTVTVRNVGEGDLVISDIALVGSGNSAFGLNAQIDTLATGEEMTFTVDFTPNAWVAYDLDVVVSSNDPDEPEAGVGLTGSGAEDPNFEEGFDQEYYSSVDVLWVVDNSGSMSGALNQVQTNFRYFIGEFVNLGLDFHLGVITTDMDNPDQSGKLQGSVTYIDDTHPDPATAFIDAITQGSNGSGSERGFLAAQTALSEPLVSGFNAGFLRPDAALATIVVTDEDDDSDGIFGPDFGAWFNGLKSNPDDATFSAICGDPGFAPCTDFASGITASPGNQYVDAVDATGGIWQSICTSDFDIALRHLSLTAAGMDYEFPLSRVPSNIGEMLVMVEGVEVPYYNGSEGWSYNTDANSIIFHDGSIPGPGDHIDVSYPVAGECPQ